MVEGNENLLYFLDNKPYINMTNACTNACVFCLRNQKDDVQGANLWLDKDNTTASAVIEQIEAKKGDSKKIFSVMGIPSTEKHFRAISNIVIRIIACILL